MSKKNVTKAKKVYNIVSTVIIALIFVFLVVMVALMLWQRSSGKDSSIFGYYVFDVLTDSMSGTIEPKDVIIAKKVDDPTKLKEGDIITFIAPSGQLKGENITHRIVEVEFDADGNVQSFRTKGDNPNVDRDDWHLAPSEVKAKYLRKSPFIKGFREFLTHWYGYVLIIALPLTVVGVLIIVGYVRDKLAIEREKLKTENAAAAVDSLTEEERKKLLEEILNSQSGTDKKDGFYEDEK